MQESEGLSRRRHEETKARAAIRTRNERRTSDAVGIQPAQRPIVGGCITRSPSRHEKPRRWDDVTWNWVLMWCRKRTEAECESSTEAEIVGTDDCVPQTPWTLCFLEAQGHKIKDNVLCQDNKRSTLLETNGRGSSGKRTRHVGARCFFIADRVKPGEIRIEHWPTGIVIADCFAKALQGALLIKLRDMIMGNTDIPPPSNVSAAILVPSVGIPDGQTLQESRSVLKDEIAVRDPPRTPMVLPAFGKPTLKSAPAGTDSRDYVAVKKDVKKTLSWAEIAQKQRDDDDHSFYEILTLTN